MGNNSSRYSKKQVRPTSPGSGRNYGRLSSSPSRNSAFSSRSKLNSPQTLQYTTSLAAELRMLRRARERKRKVEQRIDYVDSKASSPDLEIISRSPTPAPVKPTNVYIKVETPDKNSPPSVPEQPPPPPPPPPAQTYNNVTLQTHNNVTPQTHNSVTAVSEPESSSLYRETALEAPAVKLDSDIRLSAGSGQDPDPRSKGNHMSTLPKLPLPDVGPPDDADFESSPYRYFQYI